MAGKKHVFNPKILNHPPVEQTGVEERAIRFTKRSIKGSSKMQGLHMILSMIDLTTLEGKDTPGKVNQLCAKARHLHDHIPGLPTVAAICVYPSMVSVAKKALQGSSIKVASVATAFPSGQSSLRIKLATLPVTLVMLETIRDHFQKTGKKVGMKPAGGISKSKLALHYLVMVKETLGDAWLDNHWFRFGASSLANDVLMQVAKETQGNYQSPTYFSID